MRFIINKEKSKITLLITIKKIAYIISTKRSLSSKIKFYNIKSKNDLDYFKCNKKSYYIIISKIKSYVSYLRDTRD